MFATTVDLNPLCVCSFDSPALWLFGRILTINVQLASIIGFPVDQHVVHQKLPAIPPFLGDSVPFGRSLACNHPAEVPCVENPISRKFRSGVSGQMLEVQTNEIITEQKEAASAPTYASILKKGVKWAPVTVHSF